LIHLTLDYLMHVTPTSHASTHISGGSDSIKLDDLAAPDDNTDLDATVSAHGLLPKLGGGTTNFLRADGTWAAPAGGTSSPLTAKGDLYTYDTDNNRLPVGVDGQVLKANSSTSTGLEWAAESGGGSVPVEDNGSQIVAATNRAELYRLRCSRHRCRRCSNHRCSCVGDALPTAGAAIDVFVGVPASTQSITSTTFADVPWWRLAGAAVYS
jgi:hypothetical protein